jgi:hypothetical protein
VKIWFGDFNYRISLSGDEVKNAVRIGDFAYLNNHDQLNQQRAIGNVTTNCFYEHICNV